MATIEEVTSRIADAAEKTNREPKFPGDCRGDATIAEIYLRPTRTNGDAVFALLRIDTCDARAPGATPCSPGMVACVPFFLEGRSADSNKRDLKDLILKALGADPKKTKPEDFREAFAKAIGAQQALRGFKVSYETRYHRNKEDGSLIKDKRGDPNVFVDFFGSVNSAASVKDARAELDKTHPLKKR